MFGCWFLVCDSRKPANRTDVTGPTTTTTLKDSGCIRTERFNGGEMTFEEAYERAENTCTQCGSEQDVDVRYSFGIYAGRLCLECCKTFRDGCGEHGQPQGDVRDTHEFEYGGWSAIDGEDY